MPLAMLHHPRYSFWKLFLALSAPGKTTKNFAIKPG